MLGHTERSKPASTEPIAHTWATFRTLHTFRIGPNHPITTPAFHNIRVDFCFRRLYLRLRHLGQVQQ